MSDGGHLFATLPARTKALQEHAEGITKENSNMSHTETVVTASQDENPLAKYMPKPQVSYPDIPLRHAGFLKKVYVQTWGCQMNVADTERMLSLLGRMNYRPTEVVEEADFILLNTCHIREKARHKVVSRLGELRALKERKPDTLLGVSGCVAQAEAKALAKEAPFVDVIFGPDQIEELPTLVEQALLRPVVKTEFNSNGYSIPVDVIPPYFDETKQEVSKFINIVKGCNNFCTFCVVPYTRGREKSRVSAEVVAEAAYFASRGVKEIVLLGQNVNSYGLDLAGENHKKVTPEALGSLPFAELLYEVAAVPGVERIRFTTSNPHDFTPQLARAFEQLPELCDAFHLPVQSGSDRILDRMNRQYTRAEYLERVGWIRAVRPEMAFSTDIIVGFPGETDEDFEDTLSLVREMQYAFIYAFKYSPRRGTPATRFKEQVPESVKDARLQTLLELQKKETERQNAQEIGQVRNVLVLYKNKKEANAWYGRTFQGRLVKVHSTEVLLGQTLPVKISGANVTALEGSPV
ncbi:MAG: tRNA (N6-isopentenyl adenosine(37)-C2)-methylthiotransferase MiaB [Silvanigrellales bacterium]|nr:tRNA (N6-isopentenyl adenosine(37)-C2)-methylthiotransferase MiaB [Silvanigrellales bacterium]